MHPKRGRTGGVDCHGTVAVTPGRLPHRAPHAHACVRDAVWSAVGDGKKSEIGMDESVVMWVRDTHGPRPHRAVAWKDLNKRHPSQ